MTQAKSRLYGRRIKGDIGPLNIDPASRLPGRIFGPAVSLDGADQYYDEASDIQHFTFGSRMVVDERVFHYASAGGTLNPGYGAKQVLPQHVAFAAIAGCTQGEYTVVVTTTVNDGVLGDGHIAANELSGGFIVIFTPGNNAINRRIVANSVVGPAPLTYAMTVTVDRPWPVDVANTEHAEMMASPYRLVQTGNFPVASVMGMPQQIATVNQFIWLQTWGPTWVVPGGAWIGNDNRRAVFLGNGSIQEYTWGDALVQQAQLAGYILCNGQAGAAGAPFLQLMIAP